MGYSKFHNLETFEEYYVTFSLKSLEYALDILENFPDCGTLNIPCIFQRFYTKRYVIYPKHILDNFPDCETLNIPCIFQRFYTKSYIMYSKHILGIFQIVEYKILIIYSFPEIHQKILNIQELPETRRFYISKEYFIFGKLIKYFKCSSTFQCIFPS